MLGIALPQIGQKVTREDVIRVAAAAEKQGYDSLWVLERLLWPLNPKVPYPATPDGKLPVEYQNVLDPIETLTFVAAITKRIRLGTSVIDILYHNPLILARRLSTLDVLSEGRLVCGFGIGWSPDEFEAAGVPFKQRGARADEFLQVVKAVWSDDIVEFKGKYYTVPKSKVGPKPVQRPHPPVFIGGFTPKTFLRVIRFGDGWHPVLATGLEQLAASIKQLKDQAVKVGRDPKAVKVLLRTFPRISDKAPEKRMPLVGTPEQVTRDLLQIKEIGVDEVFFDFNFSPEDRSLDLLIDRMQLLKKAVS